MATNRFEELGIEYVKTGDYYVPNLGQFDEDDETEEMPLGKYALIRKSFLQEHKEPIFNHLMLSGKLYPHLREVDKRARHLLDTLKPQYMEKYGVTEELKRKDQLGWVSEMISIVGQIEEIIFAEIVYI